MDIKESFVSKENTGLLIDNIKRTILINLKKVILINEDFFMIFNKIATSVFSFESSLKTPIDKINNTVIKEVAGYIISKEEKFSFEEPVTLKYEPVFKNEDSLFKQKEDTMRIIFNTKTLKDLNLQKVLSVKLLNIEIKNIDYIIDENNNKLVFQECSGDTKDLFSQEYSIKIEPGDYTIPNFIETLQELMTVETGNKYKCCFNEITKKINISIENKKKFKILQEKSSLVKIIKISTDKANNILVSDSCVILQKKKYFNLLVSSSNQDDVSTTLIKEPVIFSQGNILKFHNYTKNLDSPIYIKDIAISFDDYNTREAEFLVLLEFKILI